MKYQLATFKELDFDARLSVLEMILSDDYYEGLWGIEFWMSLDFDYDSQEPLPVTPPEIQIEEHKKMDELLAKLTEKLFSIYTEIKIEDNGDVFTIEKEKILVGNLKSN